MGYETDATGVGDVHSWIRLRYRHRDGWGGEWIDCDYTVNLTTTPCHLGGQRYWFLCPLQRCGRRVGVLYSAGKHVGCRRCYNLCYSSQQQNWDNIYSRMGRYLDLQEKEQKMRIKFWRGMPTKRYARLMRKQEARAVYAPLLMHHLAKL